MKRLLPIIGLFLALNANAAAFTTYITNVWFMDGSYWLQFNGRGFVNTNDTFSALYPQGFARFHAYGPGQSLWQVNGSELLLGGGVIIEPDATNNAFLINYPFGSGVAGNAVPFQIQTNGLTGLYIDTNLTLTTVGQVVASGVKDTGVTSAAIVGTDGSGNVIASGSTIQTNSVQLGTRISNINFVPGANTTVTGAISGATATIGISSTASGGTWIREIFVAGGGGGGAGQAITAGAGPWYAPLAGQSVWAGSGTFTGSENPNNAIFSFNGGYLSNFWIFKPGTLANGSSLQFIIRTNSTPLLGLNGFNSLINCIMNGTGASSNYTNDLTHSATALGNPCFATLMVTNYGNVTVSGDTYAWGFEWFHQN